MKKDALGNPVVMGNCYGYSQSTNGSSSVVIGEAVNETKTGITLRALSKLRSIYSDEGSSQKIDKQSVTVKAIHLFPVNLNDVNAEMHVAIKDL